MHPHPVCFVDCIEPSPSKHVASIKSEPLAQKLVSERAPSVDSADINAKPQVEFCESVSDLKLGLRTGDSVQNVLDRISSIVTPHISNVASDTKTKKPTPNPSGESQQEPNSSTNPGTESLNLLNELVELLLFSHFRIPFMFCSFPARLWAMNPTSMAAGHIPAYSMRRVVAAARRFRV